MDCLRGDAFWEQCLEESPRTFHLAIFVPPYLDLILEGRKTAELRFSRLRIAPYGQVAAGDVLLLKRSGGPIAGICLIERVWACSLEATELATIRSEFAEALCATDSPFWRSNFSALASLRRRRERGLHRRDRLASGRTSISARTRSHPSTML